MPKIMEKFSQPADENGHVPLPGTKVFVCVMYWPYKSFCVCVMYWPYERFCFKSFCVCDVLALQQFLF